MIRAGALGWAWIVPRHFEWRRFDELISAEGFAEGGGGRAGNEGDLSGRSFVLLSHLFCFFYGGRVDRL